jgi:cellobiose-specific phosphotransferase system component IIB
MKKYLLILATGMSTVAFAQKVDNKLSFQKGKYDVVTEISKNSSTEVMGQSMEQTVTSTTHEILDVEDVNPNGARIEHKLKRLQFTSDGMGQTQSFDSEKEEDMKGEVGKIMEKSLKNKYSMVVDRTGKIVSVKADDDNTQVNKQDDGLSDMMSSQLGVNLMLPKAGTNSLFKILPDKAISLGDAWIDTSSANGVTSKCMYRVNNITNDEVVLDVTEDRKIVTTQTMMGIDATVNMTDKFTGKIVLDRKTGLLKSKSGNSVTEGTVEAQGMTIPSSAKGKITTTVTASK